MQIKNILIRTIVGAAALCLAFTTLAVFAEPKKKDFTPEFVAQCKAKAEAGNAEAQALYGRALLEGWGVESNHVAAIRWLSKSAKAGNPVGQFLLGNCYGCGTGVKEDATTAFEWYLKSATHGNAIAQYELARCLRSGIGVPRDAAKAVEWYRKSAVQGYAKAQCSLGECYEHGEGVKESKTTAVEWYRKAAMQGYDYAQWCLGWCFKDGRGVEKDMAKAVEWYRKAAIQGHVMAINELGLCFEEGNGVIKDREKAVKCYRKAADLGFVLAKENLIRLSLRIIDLESIYTILREYKTVDYALACLSEPPKPMDNKALGDALIGWTDSRYLENAPTTWECKDRRKYHGKWTTCDRSGKVIRIQDEDGALHLYVGALCDRDRDFVEGMIAGFRNDLRYVWKDGFFVSKKNLSGIEQALELIKSKSPAGKQHVKIFQVTGRNTALAHNGSPNQYGRYEDRQLINLIGDDVGRLYAEGEDVVFDNLYWASTYTYDTKGGSTKTIPQVATDLNRAVRIVRSNFGLYDETDPVLGQSEKGATESTDTKNGSGQSGSDVQSQASSIGSGFLVTRSGYFLTNHHVIQGASKLEVLLNGQKFAATCIDYDSDLDIALLKVNVGGNSLPFITFAGKRKANLAEDVYAIGYPRPTIQGTAVKVTKGVISGLRGIMDDPHCYQIDAAIQPGNSGGPLVDAEGNVLGMVVAKLKNTETMLKAGDIAQNVNYAIKSSFILAFLDSNPECEYKIADKTAKSPANTSGISEDVTKACGLVIAYE